jgi:hypothetical protein
MVLCGLKAAQSGTMALCGLKAECCSGIWSGGQHVTP